MIPVNSQGLFRDALDCLSLHKRQVGAGFKGRFVQMFLGMKFFQNGIPSMYSGSFISTEMLQLLLDDLFTKVSLPANQCVLSLFEGNFLARTGLVAPGNNYPQNTWRNNFNLQKGIGCYAPAADLSSMSFLNEDRSNCRYLQHSGGGGLAGARCGLCFTGAGYRNESHRKWLRIDPNGAGYAVTDLQNISNYTPYVAPSGYRIPLFPLIVALYHDSDPGLVIGTRAAVSIMDFAADFNMSMAEVSAYFDDSPSNPLNARLMQSLNWTNVGTQLNPTNTVTLPFQTVAAPIVQPYVPQVPNLSGTIAPPPGINNGWEAEQYVAMALAAAGWTVYGVSRQQVGYDIFAQRGLQKRYVEVKSSLGLCSPSLTAREWQQAAHYRGNYILAVLENFNPTTPNFIYWVRDPVNTCVSVQQASINYAIPRSSWTAATVQLANI